MKKRNLVLACCMIAFTFACGRESPLDMESVLSEPRTHVGSDTCKMCHLEHYDSWKMTQHSRMIQDARRNRDVIVTEIDGEKIRRDLAKLEAKLKVPSDRIYVPGIDEILYTIGSQWKQRYIVQKEGTLYISPIQYNMETHRWVNYHEQDWDKRPWLLKCAKCHEMVNRNGAHSIHSFANCVGCHMPRIAKSAEIGDIRSHTFVALLPRETIADKTIPNSCTSCHKHRDVDLNKLQAAYDQLTQRPKPTGHVMAPVSYE